MLQGSLDNFALDEVFGLLSSTSKTGRLELRGLRGAGAIAFSNGDIVGAESTTALPGGSFEDIIFELLRYEKGSFEFVNAEVRPTEPPRDVAGVLAAAAEHLADWRVISSVIPSMDHMVSPVEVLPAEKMTVSRQEWSTLLVIGRSSTVGSVCVATGLGEIEGSRILKVLVERKLLELGEPIVVSRNKMVERPTQDQLEMAASVGSSVPLEPAQAVIQNTEPITPEPAWVSIAGESSAAPSPSLDALRAELMGSVDPPSNGGVEGSFAPYPDPNSYSSPPSVGYVDQDTQQTPVVAPAEYGGVATSSRFDSDPGMRAQAAPSSSAPPFDPSISGEADELARPGPPPPPMPDISPSFASAFEELSGSSSNSNEEMRR